MGAACKKDKLEDARETSVTDDDADDNVPETPADSSNLFCAFKVIHIVKIQNDTTLIPVDTIAFASFYKDKTAYEHIPVTSVSINKTLLKLSSSSPSYELYNQVGVINPATWEIKGNTIIPNFKYIDKTGMPEYPDFRTLPTSVDRTKGLEVPITGFTNNPYYVFVCIIGSNGVMNGNTVKNASSIIIKPSDLDNIASGLVRLEIRIENIHYTGRADKTFCFQNQVYYQKEITLY